MVEVTSLDKITKYFAKKEQEYKKNNSKKLSHTLDPIVPPLMIAQNAITTVLETSVYTIVPVIEKNEYVQTGFGMCLDGFIRIFMICLFFATFIRDCLSSTKQSMIQTSAETNGKRLHAVSIYLLDAVYKTRQEEIEEYLNKNFSGLDTDSGSERDAKVHAEANAEEEEYAEAE